MKIIRFVLILLSGYVFLPQFSSAQENIKTEIIVYYFHSTHRCATCNAIEDYTRKTLDDNFSKEIESGKVRLVVLNAEDKQNEEITEKYEIWGSSLLVVENNGGNEKVENLTEFAFANVRSNSSKFMEGLKSSILKLGQ